jgi:hypothetical protein
MNEINDVIFSYTNIHGHAFIYEKSALFVKRD